MAQNIHGPNKAGYKIVDDQSIEQHVESGGLVSDSELFVEVDNETAGEIVQKVDQANVKSLIQCEHTSAISAVNGGRTFAVLCSVPHKILDAEKHQGDDQQQKPSERIHQCQALHGVEGIVHVLVGAQQVEVGLGVLGVLGQEGGEGEGAEDLGVELAMNLREVSQFPEKTL